MTEKIAKSFSEEEVKKITEIQSKVISITSRIGEIEISVTSLENQFSDLKKEKGALMDSYNELLNEEKELSVKLREKYGEGTYDINTNQFTPSK